MNRHGQIHIFRITSLEQRKSAAAVPHNDKMAH